jgi:4-hydroxybenzoate polyprenyltransferase
MKGSGFALNVSGGCFAALIALTIVPFAMGWTSIIYLAMVVAVDATIVILYWRLRRSGGGEEGKKMTRMLYLVMLVFIIFFLVSRAI